MSRPLASSTPTAKQAQAATPHQDAGRGRAGSSGPPRTAQRLRAKRLPSLRSISTGGNEIVINKDGMIEKFRRGAETTFRTNSSRMHGGRPRSSRTELRQQADRSDRPLHEPAAGGQIEISSSS